MFVVVMIARLAVTSNTESNNLLPEAPISSDGVVKHA
jgi:hypothetical protein